jgi:uncharacterized protein YdhG (YjbR/CyaY superfamily)
MNPMRRDAKARSVTEYIAAAPKELQAPLKQIRAAILQAAPNATEFISYGMPAYKYDKTFIGFAAMKNHIGLYPFHRIFRCCPPEGTCTVFHVKECDPASAR